MNDKFIEIIIGLVIVFAVPGITWFLIKKVTNQFIYELNQFTVELNSVKERQRILREKTLPEDYLSFDTYERDTRLIKEQCNKDMLNVKENYAIAVNRIDNNIKEIFQRLNEISNRSGRMDRNTDE